MFASEIHYLFFSFAEPLGHVKPKVAIKSIELTEVTQEGTYVGHCPGQAYPVPVYRYSLEITL